MLRLLSLAFLLFLITPQSAPNQTTPTANCQIFTKGICSSCPYGYHLMDQVCYFNILGCINYSNTNTSTHICLTCNSTVSYSDGKGGCTLTVPAACICLSIKPSLITITNKLAALMATTDSSPSPQPQHRTIPTSISPTST